jgi:hypothetical protein
MSEQRAEAGTWTRMEKRPASNTKDAFRYAIGRTVVGVLFDGLPTCTKTLVFDDGTGLTLSSSGAFWTESAEDVQRAIGLVRERLEDAQQQYDAILRTAGAMSQPDGGVR